ncbi:MAG TPA: hypothetical protein VGN17_14820 [Bryobacteraceae bacterium]|jgi:hypothetical protein
MTRIHGTFVLIVVVLMSIPMVQLFATLPGLAVAIQQVMPQEARVGDVVTATGYGLDAAHVEELYLVDSQQISYRTQIVEQMDGAIFFKVPPKTPAGQLRLAVKLAGRPTLLEQTVFLTVF